MPRLFLNEFIPKSKTAGSNFKVTLMKDAKDTVSRRGRRGEGEVEEEEFEEGELAPSQITYYEVKNLLKLLRQLIRWNISV